ncbi:hypothetical protein CLAIMM_14106 [Cladophialophora immunda]|nr:hypothetical protein CLAIMM_14106 [Cladophialophora immunda]
MAHASPHQDLSPQDSTFLFINTLQEQLAKSEFVTSINTKPTDSQPNATRAPAPSTPLKPKESSRASMASSSASMKPTVPKWTDKDSQGARITRLKPPRQAK